MVSKHSGVNSLQAFLVFIEEPQPRGTAGRIALSCGPIQRLFGPCPSLACRCSCSSLLEPDPDRTVEIAPLRFKKLPPGMHVDECAWMNSQDAQRRMNLPIPCGWRATKVLGSVSSRLNLGKTISI